VQHGKVVARDASEVPVHADTLCIHSDTPGSTKIAAQVAQTLRDARVQLRPRDEIHSSRATGTPPAQFLLEQEQLLTSPDLFVL